LDREIELIVVDNASTDGSREFLQNLEILEANLRIVFLDQNMGPPAGRNAGFRVAKGGYVVALDDDACMLVSDIRKVPALFASHKDAGILAFNVIHAKTGEKQNDHGNKAVIVGNFHGAGHAICKTMFEIVGDTEEECRFGAEEFDFSVRCHAAGYKTIYLPEVLVLHNSFPRQGALGIYRREKWVYGYVRTLFKHFPRLMAYLYSFRCTIQNIIWDWDVMDAGFVLRLVKAALLGRRHGIEAHAPVPPETVEFYSDPTLLPQCGNAPLNLLKRIHRKVTQNTQRALRVSTSVEADKS
jgi:GT2 family glycosyltransferase